MQLRKLTVYGRLRQFLGQSHFEVAVNNPRQAFAFLIANFPNVENHMTNQLYKVKMGDLEISEDLLEIKGEGDIKIIPVAVGAKGAALGLLGIGAGAAATKAGLAGAGFLGTKIFGATLGGIIGGGLTSIGTSMLIDGVTSVIAPTPQIPQFDSSDVLSDIDPQVQTNFGFNSINNTTRAGVPVPIIYGEVFTGSVVISSGIDTVQVEGTV
jgi:predicted phage tail protein